MLQKKDTSTKKMFIRSDCLSREAVQDTIMAHQFCCFYGPYFAKHSFESDTQNVCSLSPDFVESQSSRLGDWTRKPQIRTYMLMGGLGFETHELIAEGSARRSGSSTV